MTTEGISRDDLESYHQVYKEGSVLALREILDYFIAGKINEEMPDFVRASLESYRDYLGGPAVVVWYSDSIAGGKVVTCLFREQPEILLCFWLYRLSGGQYDLRGVWEKTDINKEGLKEWTKTHRDLVFSDPHAL